MPDIDASWWTTASFGGQAMPEILAAHDFGKVFSFLRTRGWSVAAIAARTNLDEYRVRQVIKGVRRIETHKVIERIAAGLQIDRRLCRVGDFGDGTDGESVPSLDRSELQDWLTQANAVDDDSLLM